MGEKKIIVGYICVCLNRISYLERDTAVFWQDKAENADKMLK